MATMAFYYPLSRMTGLFQPAGAGIAACRRQDAACVTI
jgi:hypothetical protein